MRLGLAVVLGAASAAASHAQPPREGFWNVQDGRSQACRVVTGWCVWRSSRGG